MKASDLASNVLITVAPSALIEEAQETMTKCHVRHLPVVQDGHVVGMISDRDIAIVVGRVQQPNTGTVIEPGRGIRVPMRVEDLMSSPVWCVDKDSDAGEVVDMMMEYQISALPFTNKDRPVGIITTSDLLRCFAKYCEDYPYNQVNRDTVGAHMDEPPVVAELNDYAHIVVSSMVRMQSYYSLVVLDDRLVGIISDRDLRRTLGVTIRGSLDIHPDLGSSHGFTTAAHIMKANPHTTTPDTLLKEAVAMMLENKIGSLPVVNQDNTVAGLLTVTNIMQTLRLLVAEEIAASVR